MSIMFPTKNIFESNEMKRLFSHSIENDAASQHSLFQSPIANRSFSSADSVSPENYFDIPFQYHHDVTVGRSRVTPSPNPNISSFNDFFESPIERNLMFTSSPQPFQSSQIFESPRSCYDSNASRPIVGRKILGATQVKNRETGLFPDWTPPSSQPKSYELFPKEDHITPMISPTLSMPRPQSVRSNYSNTHSNYSSNSTHYNNRVPQSMSQSIPQFGGQICTFCRKNGERPSVYENHRVKEKVGGKYIVTCPILRSHTCQQCGVSGDDAHTITYCPVLRSHNNGRPLVSTTVKLKNTPIKSNGKRRYTGQIPRM